MAYNLTFDSIFAIKVNNIEVTSPYVLKNGDVINITLVKAPPYVSAKITYKENGIEQVKDTDVDGLEFNISNSDIMIEYGVNNSPSLQMGVTINYTETPLTDLKNTTWVFNETITLPTVAFNFNFTDLSGKQFNGMQKSGNGLYYGFLNDSGSQDGLLAYRSSGEETSE